MSLKLCMLICKIKAIQCRSISHSSFLSCTNLADGHKEDLSIFDSHQEGGYHLIKENGKGRDTSADAEYLDCYLKLFDLQKKSRQWHQLIYAIGKES
jgi:hypothetical protein